MHTRVLQFALALSLIAGPAFAMAQDHEHHSPATSDSGQSMRFATDVALRKGMVDIRQAVNRLGHYERGHLSAEEAVAAAGQVENAVRYIIANCKLPPDADAALHGIIVPILQNANSLRADPSNRSAIPAMRQSLREYERRFDDPAAAHIDSVEEG